MSLALRIKSRIAELALERRVVELLTEKEQVVSSFYCKHNYVTPIEEHRYRCISCNDKTLDPRAKYEPVIYKRKT